MAKIVFYGGKGGVGKTTSSVASAKSYAKRGYKTLLVSTDPAHSISDLIDLKLTNKIKNIETNLDGIEIDADIESKQYMQRIRSQMNKIVSNVIIEEIENHLKAATMAPGTHESALFDRIAEIIIDNEGAYDRIVFDTAPTGHTIRLLILPELLSGWFETLIKKRKKIVSNKRMLKWQKEETDPVLEILEKRKERFNELNRILIQKDELAIRFVTNPEKLAVEETKKAVAMLSKNGLDVETIVINKILPDDLKDDFWIKKKAMEASHLKEIEAAFPKQKLIRVPLKDHDMGESNIEDMVQYFVD